MLTLLCVVIVFLVVITIIIFSKRKEGERLFKRYQLFTENSLAREFTLSPHPVKEEFRKINPLKMLKLINILVDSRTGGKLARVNTLDATIGGFMKMYTLLIRPDFSYNLPVLSVDFIFAGKKRVFIIEVIDPAGADDDNKNEYYQKFRQCAKDCDPFEESGTESEWSKEFLTDFSIHIKADRQSDDVLFNIYERYLGLYLEMVQKSSSLEAPSSERLQKGMETYVATLLDKGGPAVNVFKNLLGPQGQAEFVRTVIFGLD